jgi:WD40 repeat protein
MDYSMCGYRKIVRKTMNMLYISGGVLLLLLTIASGTAWADEWEVYHGELVFIQKTRSIVGTSQKFRRFKDIKGFTQGEGSDFFIRVWSAEDGTVEDTLRFSSQEETRSIAASPDGELIAVAFFNRPGMKGKERQSSIGCYSVSEKRWVWREDWPVKFDQARRVQFSPDGRKVFIIGFKNVLLYEAKTGKRLETFGEPLKDYPLLSMSVRGSVLSPSGRYFVVWQELAPPGHHIWQRFIANKWVTVWDLQTRQQIARWKKPEYANESAAFTQDEKNILFGSGEGHVRIWSVEREEMVQKWRLDNFDAADMKFSGDYRYLAINLGFRIGVYDYSTHKETQSFEDAGSPPPGHPYPMTFFDGSDFFAFAKIKNQVCVYNTKTWEEKWCSP